MLKASPGFKNPGSSRYQNQTCSARWKNNPRLMPEYQVFLVISRSEAKQLVADDHVAYGFSFPATDHRLQSALALCDAK